MGRKVTNSIPLLMKIPLEHGEEKVVNVDTAISAEHAAIEFELQSGKSFQTPTLSFLYYIPSCQAGKFYISDGTPAKPSTNGTWFRLSGPHQESPPHQLNAGAEVLIGTVRFVVRLVLFSFLRLHCLFLFLILNQPKFAHK